CPATASAYLPVEVGVEELLQQQVSVTPNPFHSQTQIELGVAGNYQLIVADCSGKILIKKEVYGKSLLFYRDDLLAGMYLLFIKNSNGTSVVKKFVVE
nr:T9SS type A sorting domain-containing protein [Chitinophagales bacterium]